MGDGKGIRRPVQKLQDGAIRNGAACHGGLHAGIELLDNVNRRRGCLWRVNVLTNEDNMDGVEHHT